MHSSGRSEAAGAANRRPLYTAPRLPFTPMALALGLLALRLTAVGTAERSTPATPIPPSVMPRTITVATNASSSERQAASSLAEYLNAIILIRSGHGDAVIVVNATVATAATPQIAVGYDAARLLGCSADALAGPGPVASAMRHGFAGLRLR